MTYMDFLRSKIVTAPETGFAISDSDINPALKPHQRDAVKWAVAGGRRGPIPCGELYAVWTSFRSRPRSRFLWW